MPSQANSVSFLEKLAAYQDKVAFVRNDFQATFAKLVERVRELKQFFGECVRTGDSVALLGDYSLDAIASLLALAELRALVAPICTSVQTEVEDRLEIIQAQWVVSFPGLAFPLVSRKYTEKFKHPVLAKIVAEEHPALVLFSSGSTGKPKAMVHDLDRLIGSYIDRRPKDITFLVFLMFDHIGGLNSLFNGLSMGATVVFADSRDPEEVAKTISKYGANVLPASPTFLNLLLMSGAHERYDLHSLKMITYGTEPMPEHLLHRLRAAFPKARLMQTFGTSETGIAQTVSASSSSLLMKFDDPKTEYKVVNGELWLRSKTQVLGYLNAPMDCFTEDGWFRTGDLVDEREDGYLQIKGRFKELINVGGEKVLPTEVESVVLELPFVKDCLAFGERNAITGQSVAIDIVLEKGTSQAEAKQKIRLHCRDNLDRYKIPIRINVVEHTTFGERFKKLRLQRSEKGIS